MDEILSWCKVAQLTSSEIPWLTPKTWPITGRWKEYTQLFSLNCKLCFLHSHFLILLKVFISLDTFSSLVKLTLTRMKKAIVRSWKSYVMGKPLLQETSWWSIHSLDPEQQKRLYVKENFKKCTHESLLDMPGKSKWRKTSFHLDEGKPQFIILSKAHNS